MRRDCFYGCAFFRDEPGTEHLSLNSVTEYFCVTEDGRRPVEINSLFYYKFILYPWKEWRNSLGDITVTGYRRSSLWGSLIGLGIVFLVGSRSHNKWIGLLAVSLLAVNACHKTFSVYMRYHIYSLLFAGWSTLVFWRLLKKPNLLNWLYYNLLAIINIYVSLNNITLLPAHWLVLALVLRRKYGSFKLWPSSYKIGLALSALTSLAAFLPMPLYDSGALGRMDHYAPLGWPLFLNIYSSFVGLKQDLASWEGLFCLLSVGFFLAVGIKTAFDSFRGEGKPEALTLAAWLIVPILLHIVISALIHPIIITRNLIFLMIPFAVLTAAGIRSCARGAAGTVLTAAVWSLLIPLMLHQCNHIIYYDWDAVEPEKFFLNERWECCEMPGDHLKRQNNDLYSLLKEKLRGLSSR
ncbi:hypothetical protein IJT93_11855 [bacterium]|nr:hypothetical protein [bacterium]